MACFGVRYRLLNMKFGEIFKGLIGKKGQGQETSPQSPVGMSAPEQTTETLPPTQIVPPIDPVEPAPTSTLGPIPKPTSTPQVPVEEKAA